MDKPKGSRLHRWWRRFLHSLAASVFIIAAAVNFENSLEWRNTGRLGYVIFTLCLAGFWLTWAVVEVINAALPDSDE